MKKLLIMHFIILSLWKVYGQDGYTYSGTPTIYVYRLSSQLAYTASMELVDVPDSLWDLGALTILPMQYEDDRVGEATLFWVPAISRDTLVVFTSGNGEWRALKCVLDEDDITTLQKMQTGEVYGCEPYYDFWDSKPQDPYMMLASPVPDLSKMPGEIIDLIDGQGSGNPGRNGPSQIPDGRTNPNPTSPGRVKIKPGGTRGGWLVVGIWALNWGTEYIDMSHLKIDIHVGGNTYKLDLKIVEEYLHTMTSQDATSADKYYYAYYRLRNDNTGAYSGRSSNRALLNSQELFAWRYRNGRDAKAKSHGITEIWYQGKGLWGRWVVRYAEELLIRALGNIGSLFCDNKIHGISNKNPKGILYYAAGLAEIQFRVPAHMSLNGTFVVTYPHLVQVPVWEYAGPIDLYKALTQELAVGRIEFDLGESAELFDPQSNEFKKISGNDKIIKYPF